MLEVTPTTSRTVNNAPACLRGRDQERLSRPQTPPDQDRIELSAQGEQERLQADAALQKRIAELRASIAAGTYLTPDKIEYVIDRLHEELTRGGPQAF
jgi:anti-sigma28 factor (negative regulator of flagellin synthesis)